MDNFLYFLQQNKWPITIFCGICFLFLMFMTFKGTKSEIKKASKVQIYWRRAKLWIRKLYVSFMHLAEKVPVLGDIIGNTCHSYKCAEALTEDEAVLRTGRTLVWSLVSFIVFLAFGIYWFGDIIQGILTGFVLAHIVYSSLKSSSQKFLVGLMDAVEDFLLAYHKSSGNVDEAFYAVARTKNPVAKHFEVMHDYIKRAYVSDTPEQIQSEYNIVAPSRFLRNLYTIIYMTYKYGDQKEEGRSALNVNIMEIQEQIGDALYQQNKLVDDTMGERWFIIIPVYAIPLLASYMLEYFAFEGFEFIESFITSSIGYGVEVLCSVVMLVCYLLYTQMVNRNILEVKVRSSWENKALRNPWVRKATIKLLPLDSPARAKQQAIIGRAGATKSVNALQIQRIFLAVFLAIVGVLSVGLNVLSSSGTIYNDIYTGLPRDNYTTILMTQDDMSTYIDEMLVADKAAIKAMQKSDGYFRMDEQTQKSTIRDWLKATGYDKSYRGYIDYGIDRIQSKLNHLEDVGGLTNALFVVALALLGYFLPYAMLVLQAFMNKEMLLLDEVSDLQKSTIMLMGYSSTTPDSLLTWYGSASMLLAPHFRECRVTRDFDALIGVVDYKPYVQLTTSLQMAFNGLPLKEAFSGVEQRLLTQRKEQARIVENMLKTRTSVVEMFTSISMGAVIGLYMFMPLLVSMVQMFLSMDMF